MGLLKGSVSSYLHTALGHTKVIDQFPFFPMNFLLASQGSDRINTDSGTRLLPRPLARFGSVIRGGGRSRAGSTVTIKGRKHKVIARLIHQVTM